MSDELVHREIAETVSSSSTFFYKFVFTTIWSVGFGLAIVAAVCLVSLVIWEWLHKNPIIDVHLFENFNFATASVMMFMLGLIYFSSLVMMPQLLQTLMGYTAESAGLVLSASGLVILIEMPIVGQLSGRIPAKYLIALGWVLLAGGMYLSTVQVDLLISFDVASQLRIAQGLGLGFLFVPITLAAYNGVAADRGNSVSGIVNFMRNIGSSVGTSMVTTLLARREQFHQASLAFHTTGFDTAYQNQVVAVGSALVSSGATPADAPHLAQGLLYQSLQTQSQTLAYIDTYMVLAVAASIMFVLAFVVRKNDPRAGGRVVVE